MARRELPLLQSLAHSATTPLYALKQPELRISLRCALPFSRLIRQRVPRTMLLAVIGPCRTIPRRTERQSRSRTIRSRISRNRTGRPRFNRNDSRKRIARQQRSRIIGLSPTVNPLNGRLRRRASDRNPSGQRLHRNHGHSSNQSTSSKRPELRKRSLMKKSRSRTRSRSEWKALRSEECKLVNGTRNIRVLFFFGQHSNRGEQH